MQKRFSGCEIVEIGIEIEKNGKDFYTELAANMDNAKAKSVFQVLAIAEEKHIDVFKKIFNDSCEVGPEGAYPDEYYAYMNTLAEQHVFTKKNTGAQKAKEIRSYTDGIKLAISFEKDSILLFEEMKRSVPEKDKAIIERLVEEEKNHLSDLTHLLGGEE